MSIINSEVLLQVLSNQKFPLNEEYPIYREKQGEIVVEIYKWYSKFKYSKITVTNETIIEVEHHDSSETDDYANMYMTPEMLYGEREWDSVTEKRWDFFIQLVIDKVYQL